MLVETMILGYSLVTNITLSLPCHPPVTFPDLSPRGYFALEWPAHFAAKGGGRALGAISESKSGTTQVESNIVSFFPMTQLFFFYINQNQLYIQYLQQQWIWSDDWIIHINRPTDSRVFSGSRGNRWPLTPPHLRQGFLLLPFFRLP